jgi:hypothetical protein
MLRRMVYAAFLASTLLLLGAVAPAHAEGLFIIHQKVADYVKWRPVFDGDKAKQERAGLTNARVFQAVDNPNTITILFDMADAKKAKAFASSKELKGAMTKAGVKGPPQFFYLTPAP